MTKEEKEFNIKFNEKMQEILSEGFSLHHDSNQYIIQCTGYGEKDFTAMEWNGDKPRDFATVEKAMNYINKKS